MPVSTVRVGQVSSGLRMSGHTWADQPWISAILRTLKTLGLFPSPVAQVDWIPVDNVGFCTGADLEGVIL